MPSRMAASFPRSTPAAAECSPRSSSRTRRQGTVSYAIIFHDIDVALQNGTGDVLHWMAWNIPAAANGIPEGKLPEGAVQGANMAGQSAYMGPGAPAGPRYHHYVFELYALNANLDLPATASRDDVLKALAGKVVAKAAYVGRFKGEPAQ